jgi:hypothetical protein
LIGKHQEKIIEAPEQKKKNQSCQLSPEFRELQFGQSQPGELLQITVRRQRMIEVCFQCFCDGLE